MSTNVIHQHGTNHLKVVSAVAHKAGDLVYAKGFYGTVQDDVAAGETMTLLLNPTVNYPRTPSTVAMGVVLAAPATEQATTLPLLQYSGSATNGTYGAATTGWNPVGRTIATGTATTAKVQHFNPNFF